ncbi:MAG: ABC transporter ATP-binding protein [Parachlamydiales bacterium]|nr:ABC transporter ATP-binding protein [Parachlamydiales bacterium]
MTEYALEAEQVTVNYGKTPILWDISVKVPAGNLVAIVGPNGAGKSTFLKTAMGLVKPISGRVTFFGETLKKAQGKIAYVPQRESVDWDFPITVLELVLMGRFGKLGIFKRPRKADYQAAKHYLDVVGMFAFANRQISQLSGGQQQRVFIARALLQEADIYFMDEPFAGIDAATEKVLVDLLQKLQQKGKTVFVVHHDLNTLQTYFNWVILLNMRLVAAGPMETTCTKETLDRTYCKSPSLLDEAARLAQSKKSGIASS